MSIENVGQQLQRGMSSGQPAVRRCPARETIGQRKKAVHPGENPGGAGGGMEWKSENGEELVKMIDRQMFRDEDPPKNMTPTEGQVQTMVSHGHRQQIK